MIDIQFGTIIGFYALIYLVIGFVNGLFEQMYFDEDIKLPLFLISVSEFRVWDCYLFSDVHAAEVILIFYIISTASSFRN